MAQLKRKQFNKGFKRRGSVQFKLPHLAKDPQDGTMHRPHCVNLANGSYRGRQVLDVEV